MLLRPVTSVRETEARPAQRWEPRPGGGRPGAALRPPACLASAHEARATRLGDSSQEPARLRRRHGEALRGVVPHGPPVSHPPAPRSAPTCLAPRTACPPSLRRARPGMSSQAPAPSLTPSAGPGHPSPWGTGAGRHLSEDESQGRGWGSSRLVLREDGGPQPRKPLGVSHPSSRGGPGPPGSLSRQAPAAGTWLLPALPPYPPSAQSRGLIPTGNVAMPPPRSPDLTHLPAPGPIRPGGPSGLLSHVATSTAATTASGLRLGRPATEASPSTCCSCDSPQGPGLDPRQQRQHQHQHQQQHQHRQHQHRSNGSPPRASTPHTPPRGHGARPAPAGVPWAPCGVNQPAYLAPAGDEVGETVRIGYKAGLGPV